MVQFPPSAYDFDMELTTISTRNGMFETTDKATDFIIDGLH